MAGYLEITSNGVSYKGNNPSSKSWEEVIKPNPNILNVSIGNHDIIHYPTFVSDNSGNLPLYVDKSDTAMSYKPSTGELTATTFVGDLEGVALTSTNVNITSATSVTGILYPTFASDNTGNLPLFVDKTKNPLSYNPSTGELRAVLSQIKPTETTTLTLHVANDTLVGKETTDTLTNKTLTNPVISSISNTGTLTLPTSTDTLVGRNTTDTLTNKTLSSPVITGSISLPANSIADTALSTNVVLKDFAQTLTNKTLSSPVITEIKPTESTTLTLPVANDTLVGKATLDTLTNKTLVSPIITGDTGVTGNLTATTFVGNLEGKVNNIYVGFIGNKATCVGSNSLKSNTGNFNTAIGDYALENNTSGNQNTAIGDYALQNNRSGTQNTATGVNALQNNTTGNYNTATGVNVLRLNTTGYYNTATGIQTLENNTTGSENTATGVNALQNNTTGNYNTATGRSALRLNTTGIFNTATGGYALYNNTTGSFNTALGFYSTNTTSSNYNNTTSLGYNSSPTGSNQVILGDTYANTYVKGGSVQTTSDLRDKTDVIDTQIGLNFINKLRPVDYKWDIRSDYDEIVMDGSSNTIIKHDKDGSKKRFRYHHGLIAQEVKSVMDELNIDFGGYQDHSVKGGEDQLTLGYSELIGPLIKAVQELSSRLSILESNQT